jgi:hypothetical protein
MGFYRKKNAAVEAYQWTGGVGQALSLLKWLGEDASLRVCRTREHPLEPVPNIVKPGQSPVTVFQDEWIVRVRPGQFLVLSSEDFHELYEVAE